MASRLGIRKAKNARWGMIGTTGLSSATPSPLARAGLLERGTGGRSRPLVKTGVAAGLFSQSSVVGSNNVRQRLLSAFLTAQELGEFSAQSGVHLTHVRVHRVSRYTVASGREDASGSRVAS